MTTHQRPYRRWWLPALAASLTLGLGVACGSPEVISSDTAAETSSTSEATKAVVFAEDGVAIGGADAVAYFTEEAYVPGEEAYSYDWEGASWHFSSEENRDLFAANPEQYAPKYGGYCAWAVSQGQVAPIDPEAWTIVDNELYLNYSPQIQAKWSKNIPGNIAKADGNWPGILN